MPLHAQLPVPEEPITSILLSFMKHRPVAAVDSRLVSSDTFHEAEEFGRTAAERVTVVNSPKNRTEITLRKWHKQYIWRAISHEGGSLIDLFEILP
jgi:hypothetical protein